MADKSTKIATRRQQVRDRRTQVYGPWRARLMRRVASWSVFASVGFVAATVAVALIGEASLGYTVGQRIDRPIYARVDFSVLDEQQTTADRRAARASTPSYYSLNAPALTFGRIRADLMRLYQAAADSESFDAYRATLEALEWPADEASYQRLRELADEPGRVEFQAWVNELPLEREYVVRDLLREERDPTSTTNFIRLELPQAEGGARVVEVPLQKLAAFGNEQARRGSAATVARRFRLRSLAPNVEAIVLAAFTEQPTIVYNRERTIEEMRKAEEATAVAFRAYESGKPFVDPGVLDLQEYELLKAEHDAYHAFLGERTPEAMAARQERLLHDAGLGTLVGLFVIGLLVYTGMHQGRIFEVPVRTVAFMTLILATFVAARLLMMRWPDIPQLILMPCVMAGSILAIAYPRRFAMGAACIAVVLVTTIVKADMVFFLTLCTGVVVVLFQLDEIRSRTKLIASGTLGALATVLASAAGGFWEGHTYDLVLKQVMWAGGSVLMAAFIISGILPLIERLFRIATSLTLLEWRDPTRPLLQLLAREAPGTYNHSLVLGTLSDAACTEIGANGLLAQVGALYHDIGKIHKADYFVENQEGKINRHDNLAPTMSLLIIVGHVKDGVEMAREYKLPRLLHQFIQEHHGTTVVRYFHHIASEKQPRIASGKHDREVSEAEFRYAGPKPRSKESAVLMLCDGVEGAVRALQDPTPTRIEGVVHNVVMDRLNDGQFDDCDITLREIRQVEDSLVKSLCSIYHGRVAYPKAQKQEAAHVQQEKISV